jgi:hypothetical protein
MTTAQPITDKDVLDASHKQHFCSTYIAETHYNEFSVQLKCGVRRFVERLDVYKDGSYTLITSRTPANTTYFEEDSYSNPIHVSSGWDLSRERGLLRDNIKSLDTSVRDKNEPIYGLMFEHGVIREILVQLPPKVDIPFQHKPYPKFPWLSAAEPRFIITGYSYERITDQHAIRGGAGTLQIGSK